MALTEGIAVALGLTYLLLAIREYRSCWIAGGVASALFFFVFWDAQLPMQALLQVYYVAVAIHGWFHWGNTPALSPRPHSLRGPMHLSILVLIAGASLTTVYLRGELLSASAWIDSLTSWGGVVATWLVARKISESWLYWIVIDLVTAGLYFDAQLLASSALYLVYTALAVVAWKEWLTHSRQPSSP